MCIKHLTIQIIWNWRFTAIQMKVIAKENILEVSNLGKLCFRC
ncbi:hypothetical protein UF75_3579 [Desulfosporosinus sp. I2]|nr:hypothetical protein UF75_3579 [Desulfosporosinus sp. I2]